MSHEYGRKGLADAALGAKFFLLRHSSERQDFKTAAQRTVAIMQSEAPLRLLSENLGLPTENQEPVGGVRSAIDTMGKLMSAVIRSKGDLYSNGTKPFDIGIVKMVGIKGNRYHLYAKEMEAGEFEQTDKRIRVPNLRPTGGRIHFAISRDREGRSKLFALELEAKKIEGKRSSAYVYVPSYVNDNMGNPTWEKWFKPDATITAADLNSFYQRTIQAGGYLYDSLKPK